LPGDSFGETGEGIPTALLHRGKQKAYSCEYGERDETNVLLALHL